MVCYNDSDPIRAVFFLNGENRVNQLQIFQYERNRVRTVMIDGEVWFVAKDVCDALGIGNPTRAVSRLDEDEKNTLTSSKGNRGNPTVNVINESGLYSLIFTSRKEEAKAFRRWVTHDVLPQIRKTGSYNSSVPYHLRRFNANRDVIPHTHFSMLQMLAIHLIGPLEDQGYHLPEYMLPDVSEGRMFCHWLRQRGVEPNEFPTYPHKFEDGRVVQARLYPVELWADLVHHFHDVWLPRQAMNYFQKRDPKALPYFPKLLVASGVASQASFFDLLDE